MVQKKQENGNTEYIEFNLEQQKALLNFLISNEEAFVRCQNILKASYFDSQLRPAVRFILKYTNDYKALPMIEQVESETNTKLDKVTDINPNHITWFLETIEKFCRHRAMDNAIKTAPDKLIKGQYDDVEKEIKESILISLKKDLGTNYFADPKGRLLKMREKNNMISTGWKTIDEKLYGGLNRGEMTIFAGNAGMGKSLFLQNICLNWSQQGLNTIYLSLELSEDLVAMRLDAMLNAMSTKDIWKRLDDVDMRIRMLGKNYGNIQIKYMAAGSKTNDLKSFLKEYEIQTGKKPDGIAIDYLDLMYPNNNRVNPSELFIKDKFVSEELRALSAELGILMVTASQLNRSSVEEQEYDISHIAGGLSKVNTADNVITIRTSHAMRERGEYQVQFIKTRSSNGVGHKVNLAFDPVSLRLSDMIDNDVMGLNADKSYSKDSTSIADELKQKRQSERVEKNIQQIASETQETNVTPSQPDTNSVKEKVDTLRKLIRKVGS